MSNEYKNEQDELLIEAQFNALINDYLNTNHRRKVELITKAYLIAKEAHKGARRRSGEPYILHPIAVARIVCAEIGLGSTSICAALLHDVLEDTDYTVEDIKSVFGERIAKIVDGLTKIGSNAFGKDISAQAENFRKLLLTMSDDIRVVLVKIADRLHNMRTLGSMPPAKQFKISGETMYIYAPLAHRLGLFAIKTELEELSFKWENKEVYEEISGKLNATYTMRAGAYDHFAAPVITALDKLDITYEIRAREKSVYSIWNKMQAKGVPFEEIYDIFAVRIIFECELGVDEKKRCWDIYSMITDIYKLRPDRIRDWVSRPKTNGYQALHLTVMGNDGQWVEIQIRSRRMDDIAEKGFAAHWKYKEGKVEEDAELDKWLKTIKEILENPNPNALDFLDTIRLNLFTQEIFVFTPQGEIRTLPQGVTAIDFAYDLHSDVGDHCIGAKVNHKLVPLSQKLESGDQVEILTSKSQHPKAEWLGYATTTKAKTKIEYSIRKQYREVAKKGETIVEKSANETSIELSVANIQRLIDFYSFAKKEDFYFAVGNKDITLPPHLEKIFSSTKKNFNNPLVRYMKQAYSAVKRQDKMPKNEAIDSKKTYILTEDSFRNNFSIAPCCTPIAGDNVFGYVGEDNSVEVHEINCSEALKLKASYGDRIINLQWGDVSQSPFLSTILLTGIDRVGLLNDITKAISIDLVNIKSLHIESNDGIFEGRISVYIQHVTSVQKLCSLLSKIKGIKTVQRIQNSQILSNEE